MAKKRNWRSKISPCVIYELQDYNPEYVKGWRYRVHDIDEEPPAYFVEKDRMYEILALHGFHPVKPETMERLRAKRRASS